MSAWAKLPATETEIGSFEGDLGRAHRQGDRSNVGAGWRVGERQDDMLA